MAIKLILFLGCVFSLCCSDALLINSEKLSLAQNSLEEQIQQRRQVQMIKLAPAFELGKFSFVSPVLLENGKILSIDGEHDKNIRISTDKGQTWETKILPGYQYPFPDSMYFADDQHGWAGSQAGVFRTTDGGNSWQVAKMDGFLSWTELSFFGLQTGYLAGKHNIKGEVRGEIWNSKDGGISWKRSYLSKEWVQPFSIVAISDDKAVAFFNERYLIRTADGGKSWNHIESYNHRTNKLQIDKMGRIWAVGHNGVFFFSSDNGSSWQKPQIVPADNESTNWYSIAFVNDKLGFVVGDKGAFALTRDGGETWEKVESHVTDDLYDVLTNQSFGIIKGSDHIYRLDF